MRRAPAAWLRAAATARAQATGAAAAAAATDPTARAFHEALEKAAAEARQEGEPAANTRAAAPDAAADDASASPTGESKKALALNAAKNAVFDNSVNEKYHIITEAELEKSLAMPFEKKWDVKVQKLDGSHDELWKDWEEVEKSQSDLEILDVPDFASRLTLFLRWKVCEMRTREDKFLQTSGLMSNHLQKRYRVYRNAYQSLRHKAIRSGRGYLAPPSKDVLKTSETPGYMNFVHARFRRDVLNLFKEDSFTRTARKRNFHFKTKKMKEYWKHDEFYLTRRELKWRAYKHWAKVMYFGIKLPVVFVAYRYTLIAVEHVSLALDYAVAYAKGFRPVKFSVERNVDIDETTMTSTDTLRDKIKGTKASSPLSSALPLLFLIMFLWWGMITFKEFRLPYWLIPAHEREQFDEMWKHFRPDRLKSREDNNPGVFDWKTNLEKNTHRPDFEGYQPVQSQVHGVLDRHGVDMPSVKGLIRP